MGNAAAKVASQGASKSASTTGRSVLTRKSLERNKVVETASIQQVAFTDGSGPDEELEVARQDSARKTIERINNAKPAPVVEQEMDPNILKTMSNWNVVKSEDDKHMLKLRQEGKGMATVVRQKEEAELFEKYGGKTPIELRGRLTETQVFTILKGIRDEPEQHGVKTIVDKYELSNETVDLLLKSVRFPKVTKDPTNTDLLIAK